ncbi:Pre-mRNA-splicing factor ATP-dependent RNA helicase prp22 [Candida viswanathii]|uniref:RNA helicase n=1 Tax=Candida viswanathii TaxID=5486 RepID=A0A367YKU3_9ASCO|nr:Pre-mRNA-splicing factor ATP-dependent RNA helicase prp22 [Candida viswanathii]
MNDKPDQQLLSIVQKHLRLSPQDENVSLIADFLTSLHGKLTSPSWSAFKKVVHKNGGDEFAEEFLKEVYDKISKKATVSNGKEVTRPREPQNERPRELARPSGPKSTTKEQPLAVGDIVSGVVEGVQSYGAFIRLRDTSGLCHISQISFDGSKITSTADHLQPRQSVFVKVIDIQNQRSRKKVSLSMRGIDQTTGEEKSDSLRGRPQERLRVKRKLTSPERWEIRQLIKSGAASADDYPDLDEDQDQAGEPTLEPEVEVHIEMNESKPDFLKGLARSKQLTTVDPMPVQHGSLSKSAEKGSKFAKEFREEKLRQKKEKEKEEKLKSDTTDPLFQTTESVKDVDLDPTTEAFISKWKQSHKNETFGKRTNLPIDEQRRLLPVYAMRSTLVETIRDNQFVVIVGETGSGKTTQIVQYVYEEQMNVMDGKTKIIGCTQPRRVAATSVAKRVAEEVGCKIGDTVGYTVRFDDETSPNTVIKYMTDGMLEKEALNDPFMNKYSLIMLDEAHERTIATDVLFALLKDAAKQNPNLKVVVTSATLDSGKFSKYFNNCPVITIPGRTFPVEVLYTKEPEMDYLAAALDSVMQIHISEPAGDILVFLTGQDEIDTSCEALIERMKILGDSVPELIVLPVILATNIAETSITIDGIYYVVDPGFVKINLYDPKLGMDSLKVSPISQAQANQRSGRAGRTGPGKCYRLYTEKAYQKEMIPNSIPEIQRQNLSHTILMLKAMGIQDLLNFEFMDPPATSTMLAALEDLYILDALDDKGHLTRLGRSMADMPMEPALAKTLLKSVEYECTEEILSIVAMLSVQTIFYRPKAKAALADQRKSRFHHPMGDHLTLLNVFQLWCRNKYSKSWCEENFIQERSMRRAMDVRNQLKLIMTRLRHPLVSCGNNIDKVRRALCSGYFKNSAKRQEGEGYKTLNEGAQVYLHPSSSLYRKEPEYAIYHTLILTSREYMHCVSVIDPQWLYELAPKYYKPADANTVREAKKKQKIEPLFNSHNRDSWRLTKQRKPKR